MALFRTGLVMSMLFILLVVASPVSVLGGGTAQDDVTIISSDLLRGDSDPAGTVEMGSLGRINFSGFSGRKMLAAAVSGPGTTDSASTEHQQAPVSAETQPTTSTATPTPPARFATRFAFLFRSLAKGSSPPATGTPSPGHN